MVNLFTVLLNASTECSSLSMTAFFIEQIKLLCYTFFMKKTKVVTWLISIIYILTLLVYGISLFLEFNSGKKSAGTQFNSITGTITRIINNEENSRERFEELSKTLTLSDSIQSVTLESETEQVFSYSISNAANKETPLVKKFSTSIKARSGEDLTLTSTIFTLPPTSIFTKTKVAFLIILVTLIFTLIYSFAAVKKQDAGNEEIISERKKSAKKNVNNEKSLFENEEDSIEQKEVSGKKTSGEFEYALNQELKYASENETDLTLFLVNVINIDWQSEAAEKILGIFTNNTLNADYIFKKDDDSFYAIYSDMNFDEALKLGDEQLNKIKEIAASGGLSIVPSIGFTTKSMRIISSERLIKECDMALMHAMEKGQNGVVGFKIDIDKYKKFLNSK